MKYRKKPVVVEAMETRIKRWALFVDCKDWRSFLGKYCSTNYSEDELPIKTYATRERAREAKKQLNSYKNEAKIACCEVIIREKTYEKVEE